MNNDQIASAILIAAGYVLLFVALGLKVAASALAVHLIVAGIWNRDI